jgi:site-specific DNA recombinase
MPEVFREQIAEAFKTQTKALRDDRKQVLHQLTEQQNRLTKARELLLSGDIDPADYKTMKAEYEKKIAILEAKLNQFATNNDSIDKLLYTAVNNLSRLGTLYETGGIAEKRDIIGSMYPEKMTFDGNSLRTARVNQAAICIYKIINELEGKKNGTSHTKNDLSPLVPQTGIEPVRTLLLTGF